MRPVVLIALDSMRMLLHQRLLLALMLVTLGLTVLFSVLLTEMREVLLALGETGAPAQGREIDEDFLEKAGQGTEMASSLFFAGFYWFTALAGTLVTLFICSVAVSSDVRRGAVRMTLSRPVSRAQFILGKYCGAAAVMLGYSLLAGTALVVFAYANGLELSLAARWAPWLMFCHNLMAGSAALLLSLVMHPLLAAVVALFAGAGFLSPPNPLYYVLPSYDRFNVFTQIFQGRLMSMSEIGMLTLYALDVAVIFLLLAFWRFRTRDLL